MMGWDIEKKLRDANNHYTSRNDADVLLDFNHQLLQDATLAKAGIELLDKLQEALCSRIQPWTSSLEFFCIKTDSPLWVVDKNFKLKEKDNFWLSGMEKRQFFSRVNFYFLAWQISHLTFSSDRVLFHLYLLWR